MRVSEILYKGVEQFLSLVPSIESHMQDKENPHAVTKETVGLGNVTNALQATDADFSAHRTAADLDHPDESITTGKLRNGAVTTSKLADGAVSAVKLREGAVTGSALSSRCVEEKHLSPSLLQTVTAKVDSIDGKGLSQNDFTDELRHKLESISVTDGTATLDPAALVSRTAPLRLRKTGTAFLGEDSPRAIQNVQSVLAFSSFPTNNFSAVSYMKTDGNFGCTFFKNGVKHSTYNGGTSPGVFGLEMEMGGFCFVAEASEGMLTIKRALATPATSNFSSWTSIPLSTSSAIDLRHVFVRRSSVSVQEITAVYFSSTHSTFYVDCYTKPSTGDPVLKWKKSFSCSPNSSNYANTDFFASHNRFACMDFLGNLYLTPTNCTTEPYRIIKLDTEGTITDRFRLLSTYNDTVWHHPRDILLDGKYLYVLASYGITRYETDTGIEKPLYHPSNFSGWTLKGLLLLADGRPAFYAIRTNAAGACLLAAPTHGEPCSVYGSASLPEYEIEGSPLLCQNIGLTSNEVEGLFLDAETGILTTKCFFECTEYAIQ